MPGIGKNAARTITIFSCCLVLAVARFPAREESSLQRSAQSPNSSYLGFDRNEYPGDSSLPALKESFSFAG